MKHADVTISVLCYNQLARAKECIAAILPHLEGATLHLTANGNPEVAGYFRELASRFREIVVTENLTNRGFVEPNNEAFDACVTRYFVMLNDDAVPPPDWLDRLKAPFSDPLMALTGAKGGGCTLNPHFVGYRGPVVEYVEGACMMVDKGKVRALQPRGLFAPYILFAYCEDADLSLRVREKGLLIAQADLEIRHARSQTARTVPGLQRIMRLNFAACTIKWRHYLQARKFPHE